MDSLIGSKLADILNKLVTGNKLVQYQAIEKLHSNLIQLAGNEAEKRKLINKLVEIIPSIKSKNCCIALFQILLQYCQDGHLEHSNLVGLCLNLITSKQENTIYCLATLTSLMLNFNEQFIAKYSLHNPSHPFIEILRNSNPSTDTLHQLIYQQIQLVYERASLDTATALLKPVFVYAFLETTDYKHLLAGLLIDKLLANHQPITSHSNNEPLSAILVVYFDHLKANDLRHLSLLTTIHNLVKLWSTDQQIPKLSVKFIVDLLIRIDQTHSFNCSFEWNLLTDLIRTRQGLISDHMLILLATNLSKIGLNNFDAYLRFVHECVVGYQGTAKLAVAVLIPSLFEYLIAFCSLEVRQGSLSSGGYKTEVVKLLAVVTDLVSSSDSKLVYTPVDSATTVIFNLVEYEETSAESRDPNEGVNREKLNLLSAHFILNETDLELVRRVSHVFQRLAKKWPFLCVTFFTLYINKIKTSRNAEIINFCLSTFVDLIVPKADISMFLNTFTSLIHSSNTPATLIVKQACMTQLVRLCRMGHDHLVYPHLAKELVSVRTNSTPIDPTSLYTKALCIQEIINYRPDYYAQELLATISNLINICNQKAHAGISAILVDTMAVLCQTEVVDMVSTFSALHPQFRNEKRTLTLQAHCRFMSTLASLEHLCTADQPDSFYERVIRILWSMSCNKTNEVEVNSAAFSALSKFKRAHFKCSFLDANVQEALKERNRKLVIMEANKDKTIDEIFAAGVPASCYLDIFRHLDVRAYSGFKEFLVAGLVDEIDSMPRRVQSGREKVVTEDEQQIRQNSFYAVLGGFLGEEARQSVERLETEGGGKAESAGFLLDCSDLGWAGGQRSSGGKAMKVNPVTQWESYEKTMRLLLTKCKLEIEVGKIKAVYKGLEDFVGKAFNACVMSLRYGRELASKKSDKVSEIKQQIGEEGKDTSYWIEARDMLMQIFQASFEDSTSPDIFLLGVSALVNTTSLYIKQVHSPGPIEVYERIHFNQSKWTECLVDLLLNVKENKITKKSEFLTSFSYTKIFPEPTLKFLFEVIHQATVHTYFLAVIQPTCVQLKISSYLLKYLHSTQLTTFHNLASTPVLGLEALSVYVHNLIKSKQEFDQSTNQNINRLISQVKASMDTSQGHLYLALLNVLVECFNSLYDEESLFYDEDCLLISLLTKLMDKFKAREWPFSTEESWDMRRRALGSLVNLMCIAYKSNLMGNESLVEVYRVLEGDMRLRDLLAFYLRFLVAFGYGEAAAWLEACHGKWIRDLNDFRLNLKNDPVELECTINGLLGLITGVVVDCLVLNQVIGLTADTEKTLKPESTLKEIIKFLKCQKEDLAFNRDKTRSYLSQIHFNYKQVKFGDVFSVPSSFDYLDDLSILRQIFNELNRIVSDEKASDDEFEFMLDTLVTSCRCSKVKFLPPVNWYSFISSLLKSRHGRKHETAILELTMLQFGKSNSAYSLVKNFLVDTNYLNHLKFESQLLILSSLCVLSSKLNSSLLIKYLNKLKLFLRQKDADLAPAQRTLLFTTLLDSLVKFASADRELTHQVYSQIVDFFRFVCTDFTFYVAVAEDARMVDKIVDIIVKLDDEVVTQRLLLDLERSEDLSDIKFLMLFYVRCRLISGQNMAISELNTSVKILVENIDLLRQTESRLVFLRIFTDCMVRAHSRVATDEGSTASAANSLRNKALSWLIEFMASLKNVKFTHERLDFCTSLFGCFLYSWSIQTFDSEVCTTPGLIQIDPELICRDIGVYLKKLFRVSLWRQSRLKIIDWLMFVLNLFVQNGCGQTSTAENIRRGLTELFIVEEWQTEIQFKYAEQISRSIELVHQ